MTCNKKNKKSSQHKQNTKNVSRQKSVSQPNQGEKETLFGNVVKAISRPNKLVHFFIATFVAAIGFVFNYFDKMPMFWLKLRKR